MPEESLLAHRLIARNTATASENRIHEDSIARGYGFAGGLVPGVTIFAYMCRPALHRFGPGWLERGAMTARFVRPVYDGDEITVEARANGSELAVTARKGADLCAEGSARSSEPAPAADPSRYPIRPLPDTRPPAGPASLVEGAPLGTVEVPYSAELVREHLAAIGEENAGDSAHAPPLFLLQLANLALSANVVLGPWIHVSSDVRFYGVLADGEIAAVPGRVAKNFERGGHRFVELDLLVVARPSRPVMAVRHVAIYRPRRSSA